MLGPLYPLLWVKGQYGTYAKSGGEGFQIGVGWGEECDAVLHFPAFHE